MPFEKGKPKTGGREKGTPNRITQAVRDQLEALNCNPVLALAKIIKSRKTEPALRARAAAELMRYVHPQLRSIELRTAPGSPIEIANVANTRELFARRIAGIASRIGTGADNTGVNRSADNGS